MSTEYQRLAELYSRRDMLTQNELNYANKLSARIVSEICMIRLDCVHARFTPLSLFYYEILNDEQIKIIFWGRSQCKCCDRHMHSRPLSHDSIHNDPVRGRGNKCECNCRQQLRSLRLGFYFDYQNWEEVGNIDALIIYKDPHDFEILNFRKITAQTLFRERIYHNREQDYPIGIYISPNEDNSNQDDLVEAYVLETEQQDSFDEEYVD